MRRIFGSISPKLIVVLSVAFCLFCLEYSRNIEIKEKQRRAQLSAKALLIPSVAPDSFVDVDRVQILAAMFQFCPAGRIETVELDVSHIGLSPVLRIVIVQDSGAIIRTHVVLQGLEVHEAQDGKIQLRRVQKNQMIAEGQIF